MKVVTQIKFERQNDVQIGERKKLLMIKNLIKSYLVYHIWKYLFT